MAISKNNSEASQEFWRAAEKSVQKIESWPEWKRNIVIKSSGSGYITRDEKPKSDSSDKK
ncbi:MAG: hypothetical protein JWO30_317 [Fibrobacteres bacterium]|nr:hypothetical protein [Fibrobacterota bacterium]